MSSLKVLRQPSRNEGMPLGFFFWWVVNLSFTQKILYIILLTKWKRFNYNGDFNCDSSNIRGEKVQIFCEQEFEV